MGEWGKRLDTTLSVNFDGVIIPTKASTWTKDELAKCNWKFKGVVAIFMATSLEEFSVRDF